MVSIIQILTQHLEIFFAVTIKCYIDDDCGKIGNSECDVQSGICRCLPGTYFYEDNCIPGTFLNLRLLCKEWVGGMETISLFVVHVFYKNV